MAKFYVESGNVKLVVHAKNERGAAIWAVHRVMGRMMPFLGEELGDEPSGSPSPTRLGEAITTNERGFGRTDSRRHDTFEIVSEWNRLMVALDRLQEQTSTEATAV